VREANDEQGAPLRRVEARVENAARVALEVGESGVVPAGEPVAEVLGVLRRPQGRNSGEVEAGLAGELEGAGGGVHGADIVRPVRPARGGRHFRNT